MAFIRVKMIKSGNSKRPYSYLVESVWEDGKVKQKVLKYLGPGDLRTSSSKQKLGTRDQELGTRDIKFHYDKINREKRAGNMVRIPDLYKELKKQGVSKEELRKELLELERKRVIDLQTASDTKVISSKDREGGFYLKDGKIYDYDERPGPTKRGYINYVVWRN